MLFVSPSLLSYYIHVKSMCFPSPLPLGLIGWLVVMPPLLPARTCPYPSLLL